MGTFQPPPPPYTPIGSASDGGPIQMGRVWYQYFVDLVNLINRSGGSGGSVPQDTELLAPVQANRFYGGPGSGGDSVATFRALVAADMPGISQVVPLAKLTALGSNGSLTFQNGVLTNYLAPT